MSRDVVFDLQDVSYGYGTFDVLHHIQVQIPAERTILVTGPNGSGKTTLLKLLSGVLIPRQGHIQRNVHPGEIASLGHETYVYPGLSVWENLEFWVRLYKKDHSRDRMERVLQRVGLETVLFEPATHLSRGMAQRLSLARVLSLSPQVLLLDEPTAGLDSTSQTMMRTEVSRARERGATVLWITHSPETEMHLADFLLQVGGRSVRMHSCAGKDM